MFYPADSLKRGGIFHLCWVAESWPLRFATINHRQLRSQDIRKICDDLLRFVTNESGRPTNRFSLRLSSQLMRGLVRLYQKKVTVFLAELCMIHAHVLKNTNKKWNIHEVAPIIIEPQRLQIEPLQVVIQEEVEHEQRIDEMIQNSGNVVSNIQDITLKEATIPEHPQPMNDGFGEENPEQTMEMLAERTLEFMLQGKSSAAHHSGIELADKSHDKSHDKTYDRSRMALEPQMERISEQDISMLGRVTGEGILPVPDIEKEIPEIPEIPHPELPAPIQQPEMPVLEQQDAVPQADLSGNVPEIRPEPMDIELEELEETEPQPRRRRFRNRLIVDRKIQLSSEFLAPRIRTIALELRCEKSKDDIASVRTPCDVYLGRPCHAGPKVRSNLGLDITRLFMRNLGVVGTRPLAEREMEEARDRSRHIQTRSVLEIIEEVEEPIPYDRTHAPEQEQVTVMDMTVTEPRVSVADQEISISQLTTQKLRTSPQQRRKHADEPEILTTPKRQRPMGYISFRQSQQLAAESNVSISVYLEGEKENLGIEYPSTPKRPRRSVVLQETSQIDQHVPSAKETERSVTVMLQEAGIADIQTHQPIEVDQPVVTQKSQRHRSESSETPLGSLDRTKVSLGDSEQTTDSQRFIRDQWGTEGTMVKILKSIKADFVPVTVRSLIAKGPLISGHEKIIAARCFTSILKLKQHDFIKVIKNPETLEIEDVMLGPKFD